MARAFSFLMCPSLVGQDRSWRDLPGQVLAYERTENALDLGDSVFWNAVVTERRFAYAAGGIGRYTSSADGPCQLARR
jgi:hypothetical protein